jgi:YidC/Oxa1 family membrane protein insertase
VFTQRNILAALLIFGVFILIPKYLEVVGVEPSPDSQNEIQKEESKKEDSPATGGDLSGAVYNKNTLRETIVVETDYFRAVLSNEGGGSVLGYELIKRDGDQYKYLGSYDSGGKYHKDKNVVLIHDLDGKKPPCAPCLAMSSSDQVVFFNQPFEMIPSNDIIDGLLRVNPGEIKKIIYKHNSIEKTVVIDGDSFAIEHEYAYDLDGGGEVEIVWGAGLFPTEPSVLSSQSYSSDELSYSSLYAYQDGALESIAQSTQSSFGQTLIEEQTNWVAIRTKFFAAVMIPSQKSNYVRLASNNLLFRGSDDVLPIYSASMGGYPSRGELSVLTYVGPLDVQYIDNLGSNENVSSIMNFGWFIIKPFSRLVLWVIKSFHNFMGLNYGFILILIALIMRFITAPLTRKSYESSAKMKLVAPMQKKIQEKHKNDPQRLQKEMGKLWKEHGVNPISGCLPMLVQWPILMAFFIVFRSTIEFRGAPFILWINDLSQPDYIFSLPFEVPLYGGAVAVLPLLMGISMFLTMQITMQSTEGSQKTFMYFMNGFFILIFNSFPSGLTLYYTVFNLLSYQQQLSIKNSK